MERSSLRFRLMASLLISWMALTSSCGQIISTPTPETSTSELNRLSPTIGETLLPNLTQPTSETATTTLTVPLVLTEPLKSTSLAPTLSTEQPEGTIPHGQDADMVEMQERLLSLGYAEVGWVDGTFSSQTEAALRHFQYLNGLDVTGLLDDQTRSALFADSAVAFQLPPPYPGVVIKPGVYYGVDQALHARLSQLNYIASDEKEWIFNQYGPVTQDAVLRFQQMSGMNPTGMVDMETWEALFSPWALPAGDEPVLPRPSEETWITSIFPVGENPLAIAYDGQRLWVAHGSQSSYLDNFILPIDPSAGALDLHIPILVNDPRADAIQNVEGMLFAVNRLWLLFPNSANQNEPPFIRTVQVETGVLGAPLQFAQCPDGFCFPSSAFGFDGSMLWASAGNQVIGITPSNLKPATSYEVGWLTRGAMVFDGQCMWVQGEVGLTTFSPSGDDCAFSDLAYTLPGDALAFDGQRLWAASTTIGYITNVDIKTGKKGDPIDVGGSPRALAFDGKRLWVAQEETNTLVGIDVETGAIGDSIRVGDRPIALLYDGQRLWVACAGNHTVQYLYPSEYFIPQVTPSQTISPPFSPTPESTYTTTITSTLAPPPLKRNLFLTSPRMDGRDVFLLQQRLLELGYSEVGALDGIFGPKTDQAVRHFQEINELVVDGICGPKTWALLFSPEARSP